MVPGTPARNSKPADPGIGRRPRRTANSSAAAPARTRAAALDVHRAEGPAGEPHTTPGIPPSRTKTLEPTPITVTGASSGGRRNVARSLRVGGTGTEFPPGRRRAAR